MLRIATPAIGSGFAPFVSGLITGYNKNSSTIANTWHWNPLFICGPTMSAQIDIDGFISTGKKVRHGDRDCTHLNPSGSIVMAENVALVDPYTPGWPYANPGMKIDNVYTSGLISDNQKSLYGPVSYYQKRKTYKSVFIFVSSFIDGFRYWGMIKLEKETSLVASLNYTVCKYSSVFRKSTVNFSGAISGSLEELLSFDPKSVCKSSAYIYPDASFITSVPVDLMEMGMTIRRLVKSPLMFNLSQEFVDPQMWGFLAQDAINSTRYADTNGIQFLLELTTLNKMFKSLFSGFSKSIPKGVSAAFLAKEYGIDSQLRDIDSYLRGLQRQIVTTNQANRVVRAGRTVTVSDSLSIEYHYKILYTHYENATLNVIKLLDDWSLLPRLETVWDFLPFSFIVDWFTNFGSILEILDTKTRLAEFKVLNVVRSSRLSYRVIPMTGIFPYAFSGDFSIVLYEREVRKRVDVPSVIYTPPTDFGNIAEATALFFQLR